MKLLTCADTHITDQFPKFRTSNYSELLFEKEAEILEIARVEKCSAILKAGDLFDKPNISFDLYIKAVKLYQGCSVPIIAVPGQHDLRWHTTPIEDTPIGALFASNLIIIPSEVFGLQHGEETVSIYNAGWGKKVPKVINKDAVNILLIHTMVTKSEALWEGQDSDSYTTGKAILKRYKDFKYIISGDNHETHTTKIKNRWNINPGSLMRKRKDQMNHKPCVFILDTIDNTVTKKYLSVKKAKDVFEMEKIKNEEQKNSESNKHIEKFAGLLKDSVSTPNFIVILEKIKKLSPISKKATILIDEKIELAKRELENS